MNDLDKIIGNLNPLVFCTSTNIDGLNNTTKTNGDNLGVWKNLMGNTNYDLKWWNGIKGNDNSYPYLTQFNNTISPVIRTGKFNSLPTIDLTRSFLMFNNWVDTISKYVSSGNTGEYTLVIVNQCNDGNKYDWDCGNATGNVGCTTFYNTMASTSEGQLGINLGIQVASSTRASIPIVFRGSRNRNINTLIFGHKLSELMTISLQNKDGRYYNKSTQLAGVTIPTPAIATASGPLAGTSPMIGGVWNRGDNSNNMPYGYGTLNGTVTEAMLYYEFILFDRYLNDIEIQKVQSYIKQKYNI